MLSDQTSKLYLEAGRDTRDLVTFITSNLSDDLLDYIEVQEVNRQDALASEPFMVAAFVTLGTSSVYAVTRLIEKWIELRRQAKARHDITTAWEKDPKLGMELARLEKKFSGVAVKQGMPDAKMLRQITTVP